MAIKADKLQDAGLLVIRLGLGSVLLYYGLQKAFGAFNGAGFQGQLSFFQSMNIPRWLGTLAIISEFAGSIGVILGLFTRIAAFGMMCTMAFAAYSGASRPGVLNGLWNGDHSAPPAILYPLALMCMAMALLLTGPGAFSIDSKVFKGKK